jgi:hypothetical protein
MFENVRRDTVEEADRAAVDCFRLWHIISLQIIHHLTDFDKSLGINFDITLPNMVMKWLGPCFLFMMSQKLSLDPDYPDRYFYDFH